uniref:Uncharacterized protein n=1 Tax=Avena sativa TaxID=4498 RepID=A0ACD5UVL6_AVESA
MAAAAAAALRSVQQRTLLSRGLLMPARPLHSRPCTKDEKREAAIHLGQIHQKKEELYNLMADFQRGYKVRDWTWSWKGRRLAERNALLLQQLSVQIEPRTSDTYWRSCRRVERFHRFLTFLGALSLFHMIPMGIHWFTADPKPKNLALDWWNHQNHH